ncbi:hypothetical protein PO909_020738, partial [Leuciscus waleckii]
CQNRRRKAKGKSFYRIPKDPDRRLKWFTTIKHANQHNKTKQKDGNHQAMYFACAVITSYQVNHSHMQLNLHSGRLNNVYH